MFESKELATGGNRGRKARWRWPVPPLLLAVPAMAYAYAPKLAAAPKGEGEPRPRPGASAFLTTTSLRCLPSLPDTDVIRPTGKVYAHTIASREARQEIAPRVAVRTMPSTARFPARPSG